MNKPILGISMGDPFGNGPEITVKALSDKTIYDAPLSSATSALWNMPLRLPRRSPALT